MCAIDARMWSRGMIAMKISYFHGTGQTTAVFDFDLGDKGRVYYSFGYGPSMWRDDKMVRISAADLPAEVVAQLRSDGYWVNDE